jgi:DNA-binding transcriptional regulator YhcF (GntR family)
MLYLINTKELKLIYTERTNGKFITTNKNLIEKYKNEYAKDLISNFFNSMEKIGYDKKETIKYLKQLEGE